ncbi:ribbon-helix-helix protein, CopG family [Streptomyces netropsis]|uniref:ribbon-helix-helix protein, CopG family n=1 Tax=Streptomyces netropsis TaxID=55404 RepID=UPI003797CAEF
MSKSVTIRIDDELHALLEQRAEAEGTTVTALITQAAHNAVRDPRLDGAAEAFRSFIDQHAAEFDAAFPDVEDALALARYRERRRAGAAVAVAHDDVRARLGLEAENRIG